MVQTKTQVKPAVANPYAKKIVTKKAKKSKVANWDHRWYQTAPSNDRKTKRSVTVSPNADVMQLVGGCFNYDVKPGTIMPHPSNPTFFLPTQHPSSEDETTDSEDEVEVVRRISLSPPLAQTQESIQSSPEKIEIKKEKRPPITATITFHDDDFLEGIVKRVSENIGDLMLSYYAGQDQSKKVNCV
jgi:hypothetical protein